MRINHVTTRDVWTRRHVKKKNQPYRICSSHCNMGTILESDCAEIPFGVRPVYVFINGYDLCHAYTHTPNNIAHNTVLSGFVYLIKCKYGGDKQKVRSQTQTS